MKEYGEVIRFDRAMKRLLCSKANCAVLEGVLAILLGEKSPCRRSLKAKATKRANWTSTTGWWTCWPKTRKTPPFSSKYRKTMGMPISSAYPSTYIMQPTGLSCDEFSELRNPGRHPMIGDWQIV